MSLKQSLCIGCYKPGEMDLKTFCQEVADIGFPAVEIWFRDESFDELMEAVKSAGISLASMCGHGNLTDGLNQESNHDRIESELVTSIDLASAHGVPGLICFSGNRNDGQSDEEGAEVCAAGLKRVIKYAEEKKINLNMELLNSKVDHNGYQCDHTAWGVDVCRKVDSPRARLLYDIYHMQIMEGDIIRTVTDAIDFIGHFHTAGNPGRHEFDDTQELNYKGICKAISSTGYDLYLGHEFGPAGDDKFAALRDAFAICSA